jgi:hypothetical protein
MTTEDGKVTKIRLTDNVADANRLISLRSQDGPERFAAVLRRVMAAIDRGAYDCELSRESTDELERDCNAVLKTHDEENTMHPTTLAAFRRAEARIKKIEAADAAQQSWEQGGELGHSDEHVVVDDEIPIPTWAWRKAWRGMHGTNYGTQFYDVEIRAREIFDKEKSLTDYITQTMAVDAAATEKLCAAFLSEHGCLPSECEIVRQMFGGGEIRIFIRKKRKGTTDDVG